MEKILPDLEIPEDLLNRIIEHARRGYPKECCGILAGKGRRISRLYPMENTEKSLSSYLWHRRSSCGFS
jgi:proteasome lid subunit RPN8/RPN11